MLTLFLAFINIHLAEGLFRVLVFIKYWGMRAQNQNCGTSKDGRR
jgi:hypothetical protein